MRAVDTNVVVRLIVRDDPAQLRAAEQFVAGGAWVSNLVLAETTWVLDAVYERTPQQIATAVDMLLNHKELTLESADTVVGALENFRMRPVVGFSDCLVVEIARKAGHMPLGTFDRQLSKVAGAQRLK
jgi:predicted nucleic-acid-binding protein